MLHHRLFLEKETFARGLVALRNVLAVEDVVLLDLVAVKLIKTIASVIRKEFRTARTRELS